MNIFVMNYTLHSLVSIVSLAFCSCGSVDKEEHSKQEQIRVLIVDGFSNHDWKQTTELTKQILESSGMFTVDVSTAPDSMGSPVWRIWRPVFSQYDVVIQNTNSYGGRPTWPAEVQRDLESYVANGGGLYILHSGNNAFPQWEEYNRMIGLGWRRKDFGFAITIEADGTIRRIAPGQGGDTNHGNRFDALLARLGEHPIHKDLPRQWRSADLEVYRYARGPAENLTVLSYASEPETGLNFPVEWTVKYGKGDVYNSTFGHVWKGDANPPGMRCVAFRTLLIRAVEWLGVQKVTYPVPDNFPDRRNIRLYDDELTR